MIHTSSFQTNRGRLTKHGVLNTLASAVDGCTEPARWLVLSVNRLNWAVGHRCAVTSRSSLPRESNFVSLGAPIINLQRNYFLQRRQPGSIAPTNTWSCSAAFCIRRIAVFKLRCVRKYPFSCPNVHTTKRTKTLLFLFYSGSIYSFLWCCAMFCVTPTEIWGLQNDEAVRTITVRPLAEDIITVSFIQCDIYS